MTPSVTILKSMAKPMLTEVLQDDTKGGIVSPARRALNLNVGVDVRGDVGDDVSDAVARSTMFGKPQRLTATQD